MARKNQVTRRVSISMAGRVADFTPCPCFDVLRLWGGTPRVTWREQERAAKAQLARIFGWAKAGSSVEDALKSLRGRGARQRAIKGILRQRVVRWDRQPAIEADIRACLSWVEHLRKEGVRSAPGLSEHLRAAGVRELDPPGALDGALFAAKRALRSPKGRLPKKLGRSILAELWGVGEESVKKMVLLPERSVGVLKSVSRDLRALEEVAARLKAPSEGPLTS